MVTVQCSSAYLSRYLFMGGEINSLGVRKTSEHVESARLMVPLCTVTSWLCDERLTRTNCHGP